MLLGLNWLLCVRFGWLYLFGCTLGFCAGFVCVCLVCFAGWFVLLVASGFVLIVFVGAGVGLLRFCCLL